MGRIALFGGPGSGKTSIARNISENFDCKKIEASKEVIFRIAALKKLPKEKQLLKNISTLPKIKINREYSRNTFLRIKNKYSSDFIAKTLHALYVNNINSIDQKQIKKTIIFSGLRGLDNAKYCRLHNDLVVYLKADKKDTIKRLCERGCTKKQAISEANIEEKLYKTSQIEKIADTIIDTSKNTIKASSKIILDKYLERERICKRCVNTGKNPAITFDNNGYCNICSSYMKNFDKKHLKTELKFLETFKNTSKTNMKFNKNKKEINNKFKHDVLVGISGGKDSTATLYKIKNMGFNPLAFTFNLGYLPKTTIPRSIATAKFLKCDHKIIDIRKYIRKIDIESYKKTVQLYELPFTLETKIKFKKFYKIGREHYSIKCKHSPVFVRSCQLCRRMVVRAYYNEARKRNIGAIILGINEWTNLSAASENRRYIVSGIRKLQPYKNSMPVYVFHLPFLLQMTSEDTKKILDNIGWTPPRNEDFIESNSNSCLYARSMERMAKRLLEFHPDSTRLSREVTVGFISKKQALNALGKIHPYKYTPRQVLQRARILNRKKD